jgi:Flp pilus assembly protein TadD
VTTVNYGNYIAALGVVRAWSFWRFLIVLTAASVTAMAGDFRINLPKQAHLTPVQQLNRDGVNQARHGHIKKAKQLFVKAYLIDPDDPFTLNNLGYVAELEGDVDRALRYYELAANVPTEAVIDEASNKQFKGQPVSAVFNAAKSATYAANGANFRALALLDKGRIFEAEDVLRRALRNDPNNPFLLDSMGYVMESEGDIQSALKYYTDAANVHSDERVLLTRNKRFRGKPISEVAARSAAALQEVLNKGEDVNSRVDRLNLRGVVSLNQGDSADAQNFFLQAYHLNPGNAFTLNNIGYVEELQGDRESAQMYYDSARTAEDANQRVTYATRADAQGERLDVLANTSQEDVDATLKTIQQRKRLSRRPLQLMVRNGGTVAPAPAPRPQPPIGVPSPSLPSPQLPERDLNRQSNPDEGPSIQEIPRESQPDRQQPSPTQPTVPPQADH